MAESEKVWPELLEERSECVGQRANRYIHNRGRGLWALLI